MKHYLLYSSGKYVDEDGLQIELDIISSTSAKLIYKDGTEKIFVGSSYNYYLSEIKDKHGHSVSFTFDSQYRPTSVIFTPNGGTSVTMLKLKYNFHGRLIGIVDEASGKCVRLRYLSTGSGDPDLWSGYLRFLDYATANEDVTYSDWESFLDGGDSDNIVVKNQVRQTLLRTSVLYTRYIWRDKWISKKRNREENAGAI